MPIPKTYEGSNPVVADELARRPFPTGDRAGDFVSPDYPIDAEIVDKVTTLPEHKLNRDDMRSVNAEAKKIEFEGPGSLDTISVIERAQKSTIDTRTVQDAGRHGINLMTDRAEFHRADILDLKEYRIALKATNAANFDPTHKEDGVNFATADLVKKIDAVQEVIQTDGRWGKGRYGLIGKRALRAARLNAEFVKFCAHNPGSFGVLTAGSKQRTLVALAEFLELDEIRVADFGRVFENESAVTNFWPLDFFLVFGREKTLSNKTFMQTAVVPYGDYQDVAEGTLVDVRTAKVGGTDGLTEIGAYHRYRDYLMNANLAFLFTGVTGYA